jgi:hypothetical protein
MSMRPETENFEQLRRLLALKRHEQPPPGYFNSFSSQVIARIEAGERGDDAVGFARWIWEGVWLQRLWEALAAKPALAGVFGVAVCGLLIAAVIYSDSPNQKGNLAGVLDPQNDRTEQVADNGFRNSPLATPVAAPEFPSQSGVVPVHSSLFDAIPRAEVTPLVWKLPQQ